MGEEMCEANTTQLDETIFYCRLVKVQNTETEIDGERGEQKRQRRAQQNIAKLTKDIIHFRFSARRLSFVWLAGAPHTNIAHSPAKRNE